MNIFLFSHGFGVRKDDRGLSSDIVATHDEVIGLTDFSGLSSIVKSIQMDAGHDFEDTARAKLVRVIKKELNSD
jgi:hypothetical protein